MSIRRRRCTFETFPRCPVRPCWRPAAGGGYPIWSDLQHHQRTQLRNHFIQARPRSVFSKLPHPFASPCDVTYLRKIRIRPGAACWREDELFLFSVLSSEPPESGAHYQVLKRTLLLYRKKKIQPNWFLGANMQDFWISCFLALVCSFTPLPQWLTDSLTEHLASPFPGSGSE